MSTSLSNMQGWGRPVPPDMQDKILVTWGARAIYTRQAINLLPDRQSWYVAGFSKDVDELPDTESKLRRATMHSLMDWVNHKGLAFLRKESKRLFPEETRVVSMDEGPFHIEASPQASYGYLYIRAWELKAGEENSLHGTQEATAVDAARTRPPSRQCLSRKGVRDRRKT